MSNIIKDQFGPEYVVNVYDSKLGMEGFLVIDNTVLGPGKGGMRMTPTVTVEEVSRLARAMTWKNSLAEIPFGGAKSGIVGDPARKKELVKAFAEKGKPADVSEQVEECHECESCSKVYK